MRGVFQIDKEWADSNGIVWYNIKMMDMYGTKHILVRISMEGESFEFVSKSYDYPDAIDKDTSNYSNYSRMSLK